MLLEEAKTKIKEEDYCRCDALAKIYKHVTSPSFPSLCYLNQKIKLEPVQVKLEPISCGSCHTALYTHDTDEVQFVGGEEPVPPVPWLAGVPSLDALFDHLKRSVKVCHLPSGVHQESLRGVMRMAGPVITINYFHQTGQHMQFWLCEYQSECDVQHACKKLNGVLCHGTQLKVMPALQRGSDISELISGSKKGSAMYQSMSCRICDKKYFSHDDLLVHLYLYHNVYPMQKPSNTAIMRGKVSKERPFSKFSDDDKKKEKCPKFVVKDWVEGRPYRNPDYVEPHNYVLDAVIGVKDANDKLGFIPIDHMYAEVGDVVRGMVPNSVLNGPNAITFHPSMVCLMSQRSKCKYIPVEHSYCKLRPQQLWCSVCGRKYDSIDSLNTHLPVHFKKKSERTKEENEQMSRKRKLKRAPKEETFTCKMCSSQFQSKSTFISHVTAHENDDEMEVVSTLVSHKCRHCDLVFPSDVKMIKHQLLHECERCSETFSCLNQAQTHRDSHILLEKAKCCCEICGKKFINPNEFLEHLVHYNHPITQQSHRILEIPKGAKHFSEFNLKIRKGDFHCLKCSKTCQSDIELYSHMGFHFIYKEIPEPYVIEEKKELIIPPTASPPLEVERPPLKVKIPLASILRSRRSPLKEAKRFDSAVDAKTIKFECRVCNKSFGSKKGLKIHLHHHKTLLLKDNADDASEPSDEVQHMETETSKVGKFSCIKCVMTFGTEDQLKVHIDAFHEISADDLKDVIGTQPILKLGKAKKSAVKVYKCTDCDKTFAHELGLKAHHTAAHSDISGTRVSGLREVLQAAPKRHINKTSIEPLVSQKQSALKGILDNHSFVTSSPSPVKRRGISGMIKSPTHNENSGVVRARKTAAKLFKCKTCDIKFGSKRILAFHKQQHAEGKIKNLPKRIYPQKPETLAPTPLESILGNHNPPEKVVEEDITDDEDIRGGTVPIPAAILKSRKVAKKTIIKKVFECDICEELFLNRTEYIRHIKEHTDDPTETSSLSNDEQDAQDEVINSDTSSPGAHSGKDGVANEHQESVSSSDVMASPPLEPKHTANILADAIYYVDDDKLEDMFDDTDSQQSANIVNNHINDVEADVSKTEDLPTEEVKTCNICKKQFLAWSTICAHMGTHPNSSFRDVTVDWKSKFNPLFACVICGEKVHAVAHCYLHYKYHVLENSSAPNISHHVPAGDGTLGCQCSICGAKYDKVATLHTHMKIHVPRVGFDDPTQKKTENSHEICKVCHRVITPKSRRRHLEIHNQLLTHFCEICFTDFPNQKSYIIHYCETHKEDFEEKLKLTASVHSNGRTPQASGDRSAIPSDLQCSYCRSTFLSAKSRRNHEYKHKKVFKIPCSYPYCILYFQSAEELLYHIDKEGHASGANIIPCSMCDAKFISLASKIHHEDLAHGIAKPETPPDQLKDVPVEPAAVEAAHAESVLNCKQCTKIFTSMDQMNLHIECEHSAVSNGVAIEYNEKVPVKLNVNSHKSEEFTCLICTLTFTSYSERWLHEEDFEKVGNFRCMDCGLDYKTKHQRLKHECNTIPGKAPGEQKQMSASGWPIIGFKHRKCHACNKNFADKESFKYHVRRHWYRCFSCHYDFCSKKSMKAHLKLQKCFHPNAKAESFDGVFEEIFVECLLCSEVLSVNDHINIHFLDHTIKENGKYDMFICLMCGAPYKMMEQLREHMRTEAFFMLSKEFPKLKKMASTAVGELKMDSSGTKDKAAPSDPASPAAVPLQQWGCPFCTSKYNNYKSAWSHIRSYHKSTGKPFRVDSVVGASEPSVKKVMVTIKKPEAPVLGVAVTAPLDKPAPNASTVSQVPPANSAQHDSKDKSANELIKATMILSELLSKSQNSQSAPPHNSPKTSAPASSFLESCVSPPTHTNNFPRSRNVSETSSLSYSSSPSRVKTSPVCSAKTSPAAAAKTAGLIAQILRGPSAAVPTASPVISHTAQQVVTSTAEHTKKNTMQHTNVQHTNAQHTNAQHTNAQHTNAQHTNAQHTNAQHTNAQHTNAQYTNAQQPNVHTGQQIRMQAPHHSNTGQIRLHPNNRTPDHTWPYPVPNRPAYLARPPVQQKYNPPYRPHQNENLKRNFANNNMPGYRLPGNRMQYPGYNSNYYGPNTRMQYQQPYQSTAPYANGYSCNKRMRFDHPVQSTHHPPQHRQPRPQQAPFHANPIEHSTTENISWQSELSSRSQNTGVKSSVHKCMYCQRIFKNYINVYNHLVRNHMSEIPFHSGNQVKPISHHDGRMTVWSLIAS